jgi:recombination protein RecT
MTDTPATVAPRELSPIENVRVTLQRMQPEFAAALPPQIPAERFLRTVLTTVQMNPDLVQCDRRSLLAACMKAAQDGLLLDGREAAPVIFRKKDRDGGWTAVVQYMPMLGGLLKKLRNSGELASISAHVAYENDKFEYELGDHESITHKPHLGPNRGAPVAVYAIAKTKDGSTWREVMSVDEVEKVRNVSRAKDNGPWRDWWDQMAIKTVIKRLAKRLPSSADIDSIIASDNEASGFVQQQRPTVEATVTATEGSLSRLRASISDTQPETTQETTNEAASQNEAGATVSDGE